MIRRARRQGLAAVPRGVWVLGLVSMCMDLSSEVVHALLPLYMASVLGASMLAIGLIEGIAEATALIVKLFSGILSDIVRRRRALVLIGYGIAAISKFAFPLAPSLGWVVAARFADRVGKGIRGAPRDALIADITPPDVHGRAFGLRQALDAVGAVGGPLLALAGMLYFVNDFKAVFWIAVIPAMLAVMLIVVGVREPDRVGGKPGTRHKWRLRDVKRLPSAYWFIVGIAFVFTLSRFSEAFLVLRAQHAGFSMATAPLIMVAMSIVYAVTTYPAGAALDRGRGPQLLAAGLVALIAADIVLARATSPALLLAGAGLWGLHMGLTQGLLAALVASASPSDLRGTGFGVFNLACGIALLIASVVAGWLWDAHGPAATFYAGAAFAALAGAGLWLRRKEMSALSTAE